MIRLRKSSVCGETDARIARLRGTCFAVSIKIQGDIFARSYECYFFPELEVCR